MPLINCDCGLCCEDDSCGGHDPGCIRFELEPPPDLDAQCAAPSPGSFLEDLVRKGAERRG